MTRFNYEDILAINELVCEMEGEDSRVINENNIKSALGVQDSYYEGDAQIRTALFHHLIIAHGFQDANKRTASLVLLYDGGVAISQEELASIAIEIADTGGSHMSIEDLANRIFKNEYANTN